MNPVPRNTQSEVTFGNKELGDNLGFQHSYSTYHFWPTVNDSTTSTIDRRDGFIRSAVIDSSYLYGINVSDLSVINNGDLNVCPSLTDSEQTIIQKYL